MASGVVWCGVVWMECEERAVAANSLVLPFPLSFGMPLLLIWCPDLAPSPAHASSESNRSVMHRRLISGLSSVHCAETDREHDAETLASRACSDVETK